MLLCAALAFLAGGVLFLWKCFWWHNALVLVMAGVLLGSLLCFCSTEWSYRPVAELADSQHTIVAKVEEITPYSWGTQYRLMVESLSGSPEHGFPIQLELETPPTGLSYGDTIEFTAVLSLAEEDWQEYYLSHGVYLLGELTTDSTVTITQTGSGFLHWLQETRDAMGELLEQHFSADTAALLQGILLGRTQSLSDRLGFAYQNTGSYHFIAVSGMHLTVLSGLCYWLFRFFLGRKGRRIATLLVIWLFVLFTGCPSSALRSGIMLTVLMVGGLFQQEGDGLISLSMAGIVIVLIQPFAALDVGFLMSYCATLGILTLSRPLLRKWNTVTQKLLDRYRHSRRFGFFRLCLKGAGGILSPLVVAFGANLMILPLLVFTYGYYSLWSIPASLLLAVFSAPLLWLGMMLLLFLGLGMAPAFLILPLEWMANLLDRCLFSMASVPWMVLGAEDLVMQVWSILVFLLALLAAARPVKKAAVLCSAAAGAALVIALTWVTVSHQDTELYFASDGYCTDVVITQGRSAVVLVGREDGYVHETTYELLRRKGIWQIEALVILRDDWEDGSDYNWLLWGIPPNQVLVSPDHTQALAMDWEGQTAQPLTEDTLLLGEGFQISFADSPTGWDAVLDWNGDRLLLTGSRKSALEGEWDVLLLTGTVYPDYQEMGEVLVLTKPWQTDSPAWCQRVYEEGGTLKQTAEGLAYQTSG